MSVTFQQDPGDIMGQVWGPGTPNGEILPYGMASMVPTATGTGWLMAPSSLGPVLAISAAITVTPYVRTILATVASGYALTLPAAGSVPAGFTYDIKKIDAAAATLTITAAGSDKIDGAATNTSLTAQYYWIRIMSDGASNWWILGAGTT